MKIFLRVFYASLCVFLIGVIALRPEIYVQSAFTGIKLWATVVLPSLLPFFFLTTLSSALGITGLIASSLEKPFSAIFRQSGICSYAFLSSVLSGYPVGAKIISEFKAEGVITSDEATRASVLCSTSGPMFIVGSVGVGMFNDKRVGALLFFSHVISAIICGLLVRFYGKSGNTTERLKPAPVAFDGLLYECAYSAVISVAVVGGFICVFYLFADVCGNFNLLFPAEKLLGGIIGENHAEAFASGLIECTRGCLALSACGLNRLTVSLACALVSFGGLSVLIQSAAFLSKAKAKISIFITFKIIQSIIAFAVCYATYPLFI